MPAPPDTAALLRDLTAAAGSRANLQETLDALLAAAVQAVPSCVSVALTVQLDGPPFTVLAVHPPAQAAPVRSTLGVRLPQRRNGPQRTGTRRAEPGEPRPRVLLLLRASEPGAFTALAADTAGLLDTHQDRVVIDEHLQARDEGPDETSAAQDLAAALTGAAVINQALGVLLDRGLTGGDARHALQQLAEATASTYTAAAATIIAGTRQPDLPPAP